MPPLWHPFSISNDRYKFEKIDPISKDWKLCSNIPEIMPNWVIQATKIAKKFFLTT